MSGEGNIIYIYGYRWRDVTHQTTTGPIYSQRQVEEVGGDLRRIREASASSED